MGKLRKSHKHLPARMYLKSGRYYLVTVDNKWIGLSRNYADAMAEYGKLTDHSSKICRKVSEMIDRYIAEIPPTKALNTHKANMQAAKFLKVGLGDNLIESLTAQVIYQYLDARSATPYAANRELVVLKESYKKGIKWGYASRNPCLNIEKFKETPRDRYITREEYIAFRDYAGDLIAAYMDFKYVTGLRRCDILSLRLDQLKDDGIHVHMQKTKRDLIINWKTGLIAAVNNIKQLRRRVGGLYLFTTRAGQPYTGDGFASIWQRKMKSAVEKGIINERFREHDIRAKTASDTDLDHASDLLGHTDKKTTLKHYMRKPKNVDALM